MHPDDIEPAALLVADLLEVRDFFEAELRVKRNAAGLIRVNAAEDGVMADLLREAEQFCEEKAADSPALRASRLLLCDLTARILRLGLNLLGIRTIDQM